MTAPFLGPDYLLDTAASRRHYHDVAKHLPIVDFHNHLDPAAIAENKSWRSIGEIWLEGDHYKWRAMRWNGVPEELVTGAADYRDKFDAFAQTIPHCLGNPLYHWTHLELQALFRMGWVFRTRDCG
jgi:glucuronate isomerase